MQIKSAKCANCSEVIVKNALWRWYHRNTGQYACYGEHSPSVAHPLINTIEVREEYCQTSCEPIASSPASMIYLASPYSSPDKDIKAKRLWAAMKANAELCRIGLLCYSPIAHCGPMANLHSVPTDWAFWKRFDTAMISACAEFWVLMLDGWRESVGVTAELEIARGLGKPIRFIEPSEEGSQASTPCGDK